MSWLALALLLRSQVGVVVQGELDCPAPEMVRARLTRMVPADRSGPVARARLERHGDFLRVALVRGDGSVLIDRFLDGAQPCDDLARAAAAVIASWQMGRGAESIRALPAEPARARAAVARGGSGAPGADAGVGSDVRRASDGGMATGGAPVSEPRAGVYELGAGAGASLADGELRPAGLLSGGWLPAGRGLGARLTMLAGGARVRGIGVGQLRWQRLPLALGAQVSARAGAARVVAHLGPAAALTRLEGRGFATNRSHTDFELGALGGLRAAWEAGAWTPWIEVLGGYWPSPAVGFEERGGGAARPARIEGLVVLGLSLVR